MVLYILKSLSSPIVNTQAQIAELEKQIDGLQTDLKVIAQSKIQESTGYPTTIPTEEVRKELDRKRRELDHLKSYEENLYSIINNNFVPFLRSLLITINFDLIKIGKKGNQIVLEVEV
jgi:hypothetical protein